ncbi:MAG: hypothetical protein ACQXXL_04405 [Candidatus Methanosuratincola sp.]|nr:hypothetical protein [Candidatus Methanosuratincola sp.]
MSILPKPLPTLSSSCSPSTLLEFRSHDGYALGDGGILAPDGRRGVHGDHAH